MKRQPDTKTTPPEQPQRQRRLAKPRDRRDRVGVFVACLVFGFPSFLWLYFGPIATWPLWAVPLPHVAWGCVGCAAYYLWYRRRTPVAAAS